VVGNSTPTQGKRRDPPFDAAKAGRAVWEANWELLLPVVALVALFGGFATPVEAASLTALYALLTVTVIRRDLHPLKELPRVMAECGLLVGGVLMILEWRWALRTTWWTRKFPTSWSNGPRTRSAPGGCSCSG